MLKKRLIFTLLYADGFFHLSRNFRLQRIGDARWLSENYGFADISEAIDELIILDVQRDGRDRKTFLQSVASVSEGFFAPIALGGGISSVEDAQELLEFGAEKVVVNSALVEAPECIDGIIRQFGAQSLVAAIDYRPGNGSEPRSFIDCGRKQGLELSKHFELALDLGVGELYLNSIARDGTGQGLDVAVLDRVPATAQLPIILSAGAGKWTHLQEALSHDRVDAVATANLLNFVGNGLPEARRLLLEGGTPLARW